MSSVYLLFPVMTLLSSLGSFFFKRGAVNLDFRDAVKTILANGFLYLGGVLYLAAALLNIYILRYLPYSIVVPLTAMAYIWTMIISRVFLHERITRGKVVGVICIIIGSVFIVL